MSDNNPNAITVTEGEQVAYTFTVKRSGSVVDLSALTVTLWVHDDASDVAFGTNKVDGASTTYVTDGTDGQVTYTFTTANTTFATDRDFAGRWALKLTAAAGATVEWTKQEPFYIVRNPFIVEG